MRRPVVAIHQPNFLPWLGWFAKAAQADVFVLLDDVQLERASPTQRVGVKTRQGEAFLTVPVKRGEHVRIDRAEIAHDGRWDVHAERVLENAYHAAPGWRTHGAAIVAGLRSRESSLAEFNVRLIETLASQLGVTTRMTRSSELGALGAGAEQVNVAICRRLGAGTYLSGSGGRKYNDPAQFAAAGVDLLYSAFEHPRYAQPHGAFVAGLSALDLVLSEPDEAASLLRSAIWPPVSV